MKKILLLFTILFISVISTACINNLAIQELNNKAAVYMDKGETETAICRLKSSLELDNEIYQTHYNLAIAYITLGQYSEAIEELNTVIKLKPDFNDVYYNMGIAQEALAYQNIEQDDETQKLTKNQISEFSKNASESIDSFNTYLSKTPQTDEIETINAKIKELTSKINSYTENSDSNTGNQ